MELSDFMEDTSIIFLRSGQLKLICMFWIMEETLQTVQALLQSQPYLISGNLQFLINYTRSKNVK